MCAKIILTSLSRSGRHVRANPTSIIKTMTMQPQRGIENLTFLAPLETMVKGHKRYAHPEDHRWAGWIPVSDEQYKDQYRRIIEGNMPHIKKWYRDLDTDIVLCCYCAPGDFCHRIFVGDTFEWLNKKGIGLHQIVRD
jgi:hypothetical protein